MKPTKTFWKHRFELFDTDFDADGNLRHNRLMQLLQNCASFHVNSLGAGWHYMDEKGMLWVLSKLKFSLVRPICGDNSGVTVYTWCAKPTKFFSNRMFELYDDNDNLLCSAYSSWLVIDRNSRKIVPGEGLVGLSDEDYATETVALSTDFARVRLDDGYKLAATETVRYSMLDVNKHVNNTNYITFAEDACGFHGATSVEIVYHKEIVGGDILLYVKQEADVYYVVGEVDGTMCFTVKLA